MKWLVGSFLLMVAAVSAAGQPRLKVISVAGNQTCATADSGELYCWRENRASPPAGAPVRVLPALKFRDVSLNESDGCTVTEGGDAYCWERERDQPARVPGSIHFVSVTKGDGFACGLTAGGSAWCWGKNGTGRLGDGLDKGSEQPVAVAGGLEFASISSGHLHTCGVDKSGGLWCWGAQIPRGKVPVQLKTTVGLQSIAPGGGGLAIGVDGAAYSFDWVAGTVRKLDALGASWSAIDIGGRDFACGLREGGKPFCWGENDNGELGNGSNLTTHTPAPLLGNMAFTAIRTGRSDSGTRACGLTAGGQAYCWGGESWIPRPISFSAQPAAPAAQAAPLATNRALAEDERAKQLVVMVEGDRAGAGLVFYAGLDRAYIVTAYHVVRPQSGQTAKIQVRFRADPKRALDAQMTDADAGLDVAVLRVDGLQQAGIDPAVFPFDFTSFAIPERRPRAAHRQPGRPPLGRRLEARSVP